MKPHLILQNLYSLWSSICGEMKQCRCMRTTAISLQAKSSYTGFDFVPPAIFRPRVCLDSILLREVSKVRFTFCTAYNFFRVTTSPIHFGKPQYRNRALHFVPRTNFLIARLVLMCCLQRGVPIAISILYRVQIPFHWRASGGSICTRQSGLSSVPMHHACDSQVSSLPPPMLFPISQGQ